MFNKLHKSLILSLVFIFFFSTTVAPAAEALSSKDIKQMVKQTNLENWEQEHLQRVLEILVEEEDNITEEEILRYISYYENKNSEFEIQTIPLLINVILRAATAVTARLTTGPTVTIGAHTATRALERGITVRQLNDTLAHGFRYKDMVTGARIAHDRQNGIAVVIDKTNNYTITTYSNQFAPKYSWVLDNWNW